MVRKAFKMKVYEDKIEEYTKRHNPIWPELKEVLKNHGVRNYNIFLDTESCFLSGYAEIESEVKWNEIANTEICKKWWQYMATLMETNEDSSPVSTELKHLFYME
ncbi:L-rhamnose mutarotase [Zobellia amurskyensis]|uniref:L-rhamnose mutarotase n=2 Tax=Zobellia amurskyensis TaxID=248905 RepID=A0A7X2ZV93_9FLAO|nr:L-rhamnose mutarotase [Zobellia amurskyensis]MUH36989.1 L-rhamnose mutarotase [Zobellia amurskyensis]